MTCSTLACFLSPPATDDLLRQAFTAPDALLALALFAVALVVLAAFASWLELRGE
jgi:hypothetical protein